MRFIFTLLLFPVALYAGIPPTGGLQAYHDVAVWQVDSDGVLVSESFDAYSCPALIFAASEDFNGAPETNAAECRSFAPLSGGPGDIIQVCDNVYSATYNLSEPGGLGPDTVGTIDVFCLDTFFADGFEAIE